MKRIVLAIALFCICAISAFGFTACELNKNIYKVIFDTDGGSEVVAQSVQRNLCVENPENPTKDGYDFKGWFKEDKITEWNFDIDTVIENITLYAKWEEIEVPFTVQIIGDLIQGVSLSGGAMTQTVSKNNPFVPITVSENYGYKYLYYTVDGIKYSDNTIILNDIKEDMTVNIVCEYATYDLPIVNIDTNGAVIDSKIEYTDMSFSIENCEGALADVSGGIRLRGNSTSTYDKKPYRMKFDKKQSLFGLEKAKSWVLLADYLDPSCMHNYTALTLGNELDGLPFTPTPNHINVYLNGEYRGIYVLCEQIQENKGRLNIEKEITADMTDLKDFNFLICMDQVVIEDSDAILDETFFYLKEYEKNIELKYPEKSDFTSEEQFRSFFNQLKDYVKLLFDSFKNKDLEFINRETNIASLIDFLIVDEIMAEPDHFYRSFNMYYTSTSKNPAENNKLSFGPIWDYDWCLWTPWTNEPNVYYELFDELIFRNEFFQCVHETPELYSQLKTRYNEISSEILSDFIDDIMLYEYSIAESAELNSAKWYAEYDSDIMRKNVIFLNKFLLNRKRILDIEWAI